MNADSSVPTGRKRPRAEEESVPAPSIRLAVPPSREQGSLTLEALQAQLQEYQAKMEAKVQEKDSQLQEYQAKMEAKDSQLQEKDSQLQELQEYQAKMEAAMQAKDAEIDRFRRIALQTAAAGEF